MKSKLQVGFMALLILVGGSLMICSFAFPQTVDSVPAFEITDIMDNVDDILGDLDFKQGVSYSVLDNQIDAMEMLEIIGKDSWGINLGWVAKKEMLVLAAEWKIAKLKDYIDVPILDLIELTIGAHAGYKYIFDQDREYDAGFNIVPISFKW